MRTRQVSGAVLVAVLALACALTGCSTSGQPAGSGVRTGEAFAYGASTPVQAVHLTLPAHPVDLGHAPWVFVLHGGGWVRGGPQDESATVDLLAAHGLVVVNVGYRLLNAGTTFAQQWSDVRRAWQWVHSHARQLGIDPARGAIWGASAGGHLGALLGNRVSGVRAVVTLAGVLAPSLLAQLQTDSGETAPQGRPAGLGDNDQRWLYNVLATRVVGAAWNPADNSSLARWRAVDPGEYASAASPPTMIVQGALDPLVPPVTAEAYGAQLAAYGVAHRVVEVPEADHSEAGLLAAAGGEAVDWVLDHLRG